MTTVALVGLGEAGRLIGQGLASAGATVRGYDPFVEDPPDGIEQCRDLVALLRGVDLVISCVGAPAARQVAREVFAAADTPAVYADLNTLAPQDKKLLSADASKTPLSYVDVAVMAPVPREGHRTPLLASGPGATQLLALLEPFGACIEEISATTGDAASLKLIRSVFMKGFAAVVMESLEAAEVLGASDFMRTQITTELDGDREALIERLVTGTQTHAERRLHEVRASAELLGELGVSHPIADATARRLQSMIKDTDDDVRPDRERPSGAW